MTFPWSAEHIAAMAPDPGTAKNGQALSSPGKWQNVGRSERAVWGEIRGSGANPYQVIIDFNGPVFKCSCPSRKFPCKHGVGLGLLATSNPAATPETSPPAWVTDWLQGREDRAKKKAEREIKAASGEEDAAVVEKRKAAKEKRTASRQEKILAGITDLQQWLQDLVRQGLAAQKADSGRNFQEMAARMVDAQAPGLSRIIREAHSALHSGDDWQDKIMEKIARLHLLAEAFLRVDNLSADQQADVRAAIGLSPPKEEVVAGEAITDSWFVLGRRVEQEDSLRIQRTWLRGENTGRMALLLDFAPGRQPFERSLQPGSLLPADLVFYPGAWPVRALVKSDKGVAKVSVACLSAFIPIEASMASSGGAVALSPWIENFPMSLSGVVPLLQGDACFVRDQAGHVLPLAKTFLRSWQLLAVSGGEPINLFAEWDGRSLWPLTLFSAEGDTLAIWGGSVDAVEVA